MDGFLSGQQLRQQMEQAGLAGPGLGAANGFGSQSYMQGAFSEGMPQHGNGGLGSSGGSDGVLGHHGSAVAGQLQQQQQRRLPPQHIGMAAGPHLCAHPSAPFVAPCIACLCLVTHARCVPTCHDFELVQPLLVCSSQTSFT